MVVGVEDESFFDIFELCMTHVVGILWYFSLCKGIRYQTSMYDLCGGVFWLFLNIRGVLQSTMQAMCGGVFWLFFTTHVLFDIRITCSGFFDIF